MEPPRRVARRPERFDEESRHRWRIPSPRELLALATVLLILSNALVEHGFVPKIHATTTVTPTEPPMATTLIADTDTADTADAATASRLWELASARIREPRGVVLPLFDGVAALGVSLLLELRALQVDLPVEIPHCGDLDEPRLWEVLGTHGATQNVSVYDVCEAAALATDVAAPTRSSLRVRSPPLFCETVGECHERFRSFDIKVLAVLFSRFAEVLLVDADVLFFQSPSSLWSLDAYVTTGTLFFPDRISAPRKYLSRRVGGGGDPQRSRLHEFVETFDRAPFRHLETAGTSSIDTDAKLGEPSAYLRATHAWNLRAGHHADSSVLLWNKRQQPRATAILGSFVARRRRHSRPPSYGDKELYFLACEVADARYAFSHFGAGAIGWDADADRGVLCGDVLHFLPVNKPERERTGALYINSDHITNWRPAERTLFRSNARPASHYPGSFEAQNLSQECPFDIQLIELTVAETEAFQRRQALYERVVSSWPAGSKEPSGAKLTVTTASPL